ncbi:MAG: hypothetical protein AAF570_05160 [Bacteroidota bacterium]
MATPLNEGANYLFFEKGQFSGGKVTGLTNAEVCALCTKDYIFVIPKKDFTTYLVANRTRTYNYFGEGVKIQDGMKALLSEEGLTLEELESRMVEMLGADQKERVIKISDLKKRSIWLFGPFSQARIKFPKGTPKVLVCRGKGAMKKMKLFYS